EGEGVACVRAAEHAGRAGRRARGTAADVLVLGWRERGRVRDGGAHRPGARWTDGADHHVVRSQPRPSDTAWFRRGSLPQDSAVARTLAHRHNLGCHGAYTATGEAPNVGSLDTACDDF